MNTKAFAYTLILTAAGFAGFLSPALRAAVPETTGEIPQICAQRPCEYNLNLLAKNEEAFAAYKKQAENGDSHAMVCLGVMYETGDGVPKNELEALGWYTKAAQKNDPDGLYRLGYFCQNGLAGLKKDHKNAVACYKKSAELGSKYGQGMYALYLWDGLVVKQDREAAVYWMKKSAANGSDHAKNMLKKWGVTP